jgi:hypothetical protein
LLKAVLGYESIARQRTIKISISTFPWDLETRAGLPGGLSSNQKYQFGYILEGLGMENVGIFYDHLEYFTDIW